MPKPNEGHSLADLKTYVKNHNLNKGEVPLSLNKPEMVKRLKLIGHWDKHWLKRQALKKGTSSTQKPVMKTPKRKLDKGQKDFLAGIK